MIIWVQLTFQFPFKKGEVSVYVLSIKLIELQELN